MDISEGLWTRIYGWRWGLLALFPVLLLGLNIWLAVVVIFVAFLLGFVCVLLEHGWQRSEELLTEFNKMPLSGSNGIPRFVGAKLGKRNIGGPMAMTGCPSVDPLIEEIMNLVMRDMVDSWYATVSPDRHLFQDSLKSLVRRTVASMTAQLSRVDWVPFLTSQLADDFASHIKLFRLANDDLEAKKGEDDLESLFFDRELRMEPSCMDLVSTSSQYENAYLHDVVDVLLYLLLPESEFKCRPQRFLIREVLVRKCVLPLVDMLSDPDYMNSTIAWLLEETKLNSEDFLAIINGSKCVEELEAIQESLEEEIDNLRGKDTGEEEVKMQLSSVEHVRNVVVGRLRALGVEDSVPQNVPPTQPVPSFELPIDVVLHDSLSVDYFINFVRSTLGQRDKTYIDLFLAIEGWKSVVEHERAAADLERITTGAFIDVSSTIKASAAILFEKYLSQQAEHHLILVNPELVQSLKNLIDSKQPVDQRCFDPIQIELYNLLRNDNRFYHAFVHSEDYPRMLADTNLADRASLGSEDICDTSTDDVTDSGILPQDIPDDSPLHGKINQFGVQREGTQTFGIYYVQVMKRSPQGDSLWMVLRRYSEFLAFHNDIVIKFPNLAPLRFPGKRVKGNISRELLEKRMRGLNMYMKTLFQKSILDHNQGLNEMCIDFLQQRSYGQSAVGSFQQKLKSVINPLRTGVRALSTAVISAPDMVYGGVTKVGGEIGKVTRQVMNKAVPIDQSVRSIQASNRVGAGLSGDTDFEDNVTIEILLRFMDEVFGLRKRNQWFRRQLVLVLQRVVHAAFGAQINRKITDFVKWLTSPSQVALYLTTFKNNIWPNGTLSETPVVRRTQICRRTRVVCKAKMLAALPDELRLFIGAETSRSGIELIFEALQCPHLNRRLVYKVLEHLLETVFTENNMRTLFSRLHSKSPRTKS